MKHIPHNLITYPGNAVCRPIMPGWYPIASPILRNEPTFRKLLYHAHVYVERPLGFDQTAVTRAHNRICREIEG